MTDRHHVLSPEGTPEESVEAMDTMGTMILDFDDPNPERQSSLKALGFDMHMSRAIRDAALWDSQLLDWVTELIGDEEYQADPQGTIASARIVLEEFGHPALLRDKEALGFGSHAGLILTLSRIGKAISALHHEIEELKR